MEKLALNLCLAISGFVRKAEDRVEVFGKHLFSFSRKKCDCVGYKGFQNRFLLIQKPLLFFVLFYEMNCGFYKLSPEI